jgi:hypothetical protein
MRARLVLAALVFSLTVGVVRAGQPPCSTVDHTHERAGYPQCVAWYAIPGRTAKDTVGYVGGGCLPIFRGEGRCPSDGIFGWDYVGCGWYPGRVFLSWCHCAKTPLPGPYKTDGPHVPDVFSVHPLRHAAAHGQECPDR